VAPAGLPQAVYAAMTLVLIFGIKDLVIVNRRPAYELLVFLLSFAGFLLLFSHFAAWSLPLSFLALAFGVLLWFWLVRTVPGGQGTSRMPTAIAALILFEVGAIIFLLPLSFFSQAALLFFGSALLFEFAVDSESLTMKRCFAWSGVYAAIAFFLIFLAPWKI